MSVISFGEFKNDIPFKVLNERTMRGSAGIMFLLAVIAFINGFILQHYQAITLIVGFLVVNFIIGVFINPKYAPTVFVAALFVGKQSPIYIGAIQKRFAWGLGLVLASTIFSLSLLLLNDTSFFEPVCMLCLICLFIIFLEVSFGICLGCKLYYLALNLKLIKKPEISPNCTGDACDY